MSLKRAGLAAKRRKRLKKKGLGRCSYAISAHPSGVDAFSRRCPVLRCVCLLAAPQSRNRANSSCCCIPYGDAMGGLLPDRWRSSLRTRPGSPHGLLGLR